MKTDISQTQNEVIMFGLWFSLIGLLFGTLCSIKAKEKNRFQHDWFILGFIFSLIAIVVLNFLSAKSNEPKIHFEIYDDRVNDSLSNTLVNNLTIS